MKKWIISATFLIATISGAADGRWTREELKTYIDLQFENAVQTFKAVKEVHQNCVAKAVKDKEEVYKNNIGASTDRLNEISIEANRAYDAAVENCLAVFNRSVEETNEAYVNAANAGCRKYMNRDCEWPATTLTELVKPKF